MRTHGFPLLLRLLFSSSSLPLLFSMLSISKKNLPLFSWHWRKRWLSSYGVREKHTGKIIYLLADSTARASALSSARVNPLISPRRPADVRTPAVAAAVAAALSIDKEFLGALFWEKKLSLDFDFVLQARA